MPHNHTTAEIERPLKADHHIPYWQSESGEVLGKTIPTLYLRYTCAIYVLLVNSVSIA